MNEMVSLSIDVSFLVYRRCRNIYMDSIYSFNSIRKII